MMRNENGDAVDQKRNILDEIGGKTKERIAKQKAVISFLEMKEKAEAMPKGDFCFEKALKQDGMSFICEVKKASPSKGLIAPEFPYLQIAKDYELAGATAISCLTEPFYFLGKNEYLQEIVENVSIPVLKKDFFVDPYMVYEARVLGASAVLLICAMLADDELAEYFSIANNLGLSAIFEAHDAEEVLRAAKCGARIIGVNNRNLKTFTLDLQNSIDLKNLVSDDVIFISESGIKTRNDIEVLEANGIEAVLIGETLMRADHKKQALDELRGANQ
ncbi:indole-3-glycerol phosphate synthase TrpC [Chakrabartyella piscis]|uniref:indole-3-glycerol phosphate synthase TrpC n=1 Tax=Chakrabartyella piscis TaxID=2918914 RepID=UPI002958357E|nr:indole-3-glycerol phosphate synthase TrpC [Chakrabartyella piscis]